MKIYYWYQYEDQKCTTGFLLAMASIVSINVFRNTFPAPCDRAEKLISSSMSQHLSTRKVSSKSMHAFLSNLANRQTDKRWQSHLPLPSSEVMKDLCHMYCVCGRLVGSAWRWAIQTLVMWWLAFVFSLAVSQSTVLRRTSTFLVAHIRYSRF